MGAGGRGGGSVQIDYFAHHLGRDRSPTPSRDTPAGRLASGRAATSPPPPAPPVTHSIDLSLSVDAQVAMRFSNGRTRTDGRSARQVPLMPDEKAAFFPRAEPSLELELNQCYVCLSASIKQILNQLRQRMQPNQGWRI